MIAKTVTATSLMGIGGAGARDDRTVLSPWLSDSASAGRPNSVVMTARPMTLVRMPNSAKPANIVAAATTFPGTVEGTMSP